VNDADDHWASGLLLTTAMLIGVAALGAVYHASRRRSGKLGFAVFGGEYVALVIPGAVRAERDQAADDTVAALRP
jgi:hypothetical protein